MKSYILLILLSLFVLVGGGAVAGSADLEKKGGANEVLVDLKVNNKPLLEVLTDLALETGYTIKMVPELDRVIHLEVAQLPLQDIIKRLLKGVNYAVSVDESSKNIKIIIYDKQLIVGSSGMGPSAVEPDPVDGAQRHETQQLEGENVGEPEDSPMMESSRAIERHKTAPQVVGEGIVEPENSPMMESSRAIQKHKASPSAGGVSIVEEKNSPMVAPTEAMKKHNVMLHDPERQIPQSEESPMSSSTKALKKHSERQ